MRKVRIICVGKNQDPYLKQGLALYEKKLNRYCHFEFISVKEASYRSGTKIKWLAEESERLLKHFSTDNYSIICDEKGKQFHSIEMANELINKSNHGFSKFDFFIGGPYGLSSEFKKQANLLFSFSAMTMTHQMFRLVLIEQIYRSFTIINREKYHHI